MTAREAWNLCEHGKAIVRPTGARLEKWMGDKPGLAPGFDRYVLKNADTIPLDDLSATDWELEK